ncbi:MULTISPECIES: phosphoglycolate phosphatase [Halomonadaceae]|uniref:phosphoglycolate phosphatase n=1 Tax=Halomonadaceae TaxID=28256 RepID=UPI00159A1D4E|nr:MULTISPECIES: phosphoglycolate phosphatase [Halomonas]QJQ95370.1 phosphoglycolate phosphatase [Halomonas sp. PA5]
MHSVLHDIDLVTFDLDGTLVDSVPDLAAAVDAVLLAQGLLPAGERKVRDWVGNGSRVLIERALSDAFRRSDSDDLVASDLGKDVLEQAHQGFLFHYGQAPSTRTRLYPGVRDALEALAKRGLPMALVTNKPHTFIAPILESFAIAHYFTLCLGGDSLSFKKPDPAPLLHVASHFGMAPRRCLMVGDSRHDITAGKRAGFRTLAVPYGYNHGEPVSDACPDAMVESLAELV